MSIKYRPEIDGLRTIAVASVIIYHAEFEIGRYTLLEGGFLGVDVFFVISGFLITSLIASEFAETDRFSILRFYERRARRLLPALLVVMLVAMPMAWFYLLNDQLIDTASSILSSLFFASNIYWDVTLQAYDAESSLLKPFLHTWSLAVEEQFYIVYPMLLVALLRLPHRYLAWLVATAIVASFTFAVYTTENDPSFSFYMLPSRFWELLAGGALAIGSRNVPRTDFKGYATLATSTGLALIVAPMFLVDVTWQHPGFATLPSVVGTILVIGFATGHDLTSRLLSSRLFVGVGLISYALYLWHFPIFAFGRTIQDEPTSFEKLLWVLIAVAFSVLSYYCVEKPFRNRNVINRKVFLATIGSLFALIAIWCVAVIVADGFESRLPTIVRNVETDINRTRICRGGQEKCVFNPSAGKTIFLVGDSQMMPMEKPLEAFAAANDYKLITLNRGGCSYILNLTRIDPKTDRPTKCTAEAQEFRRNILLSSEPSWVLLGSRLPFIMTGERFDNKQGGKESGGRARFLHEGRELSSPREQADVVSRELQSTVLELTDHGHKVMLIYPIPEVGWHVPKKLSKMLRGLNLQGITSLLKTDPITTDYSVYQNRSQSSFDALDQIDAPNIYRVYPHEVFCDPKPDGKCRTHDESNAFYRDDDHLSETGADLLMEEIKRLGLLTKDGQHRQAHGEAL